MREISACIRARRALLSFLRRSGQPSRLNPVGRIVEATRTFVWPVDERQAGAANLWGQAFGLTPSSLMPGAGLEPGAVRRSQGVSLQADPGSGQACRGTTSNAFTS